MSARRNTASHHHLRPGTSMTHTACRQQKGLVRRRTEQCRNWSIRGRLWPLSQFQFPQRNTKHRRFPKTRHKTVFRQNPDCRHLPSSRRWDRLPRWLESGRWLIGRIRRPRSNVPCRIRLAPSSANRSDFASEQPRLLLAVLWDHPLGLKLDQGWVGLLLSEIQCREGPLDSKYLV